MAATTITQGNFKDSIQRDGIVLLDWWAPWCGPCRSFAPVFESASEKYPDILFGKINTDEEQELAGAFQIRSIPTLMIFRDGILLFAQPGALPGSALEQVIEKVRGLDMNEIRKEVEEARTEGSHDPADGEE